MKGKQIKKKRSLLFLVLIWLILTTYSTVVLYWLLLGRAIHSGGPLQYNLVPLKTVQLYLNMQNGVPLVNRLINLLGNVVVFIPFGILLPLVSRRLNNGIRLTVYMACCILLLELMQMLLHAGSLDVDDLLLNLIGVWIGIVILRLNGFHTNKRENV